MGKNTDNKNIFIIFMSFDVFSLTHIGYLIVILDTDSQDRASSFLVLDGVLSLGLEESDGRDMHDVIDEAAGFLSPY